MKINTLLFFTAVAGGFVSLHGQPAYSQTKADKLPFETLVDPSLKEYQALHGNRSIIEPEKRILTITIGGENADIKGYTSQAIQMAINSLRGLGGGIIKLLPGEYAITVPVNLYDNIKLVGSGSNTILKKSKGIRTKALIDAGYGELQLTVADTAGFRQGMGLLIFDSKNRSAWDVTTAQITDIKSNIIYIDNFLVRDYSVENRLMVSNACSVIAAIGANNIAIENLTVDGSSESNDMIDGCRGGGIYLHKVKNIRVENVTVHDFNSDGISWQITENVVVKNCEVYGCANAGLHPGAGTLYTVIENNYCHNNKNFGLYVCWRVKHGVVRGNRFIKNGAFGIDTGHMDTDMLFEKNEISENGSSGVHFRDETKANAPHRSTFRENIVENNGQNTEGYGFSFNSPAEDVVLEGNIIRNTTGSTQKAAIFMGENALPVQLRGNNIANHPAGDVVIKK